VAADGYATVGDRGTLSDGILTVAGRGDAVQVGTATVQPADVESVLRPAARRELAVVGLPHASLGAVLAVALSDDSDLATVRGTARDRLAGPLLPRLWFHVPLLPRTSAGKVDRTALVSLLAGESARSMRLQ
jgi:acyl-CoA synthetase (AMP-forming)/AMP-acid ligase II